MTLTFDFEAARPRLMALAHRMLGSVHDAEDVVQTTWVRAAGADWSRVDDPDRWLSTVAARLCLDQLRTRRRRGELPLLPEALTARELAADEEYLRREDVSRALLVLLDRLTPGQRVAYVLHDLFAVPFEEVGRTLGISPTNAKKLASRARLRLRPPEDHLEREGRRSPEDLAVVEAFLAAARGGDLDVMVGLMAPDVVRSADPTLLPEGAASVVVGARAVAEETTLFGVRVRASVELWVNGARASVIAPGGHPLAYLDIDVADGRVGRITIVALSAADELRPVRVL